MPNLTGQCLCGAVKFSTYAAPFRTANCFCTDCQQASGSGFATLAFMSKDDVSVTGTYKTYDHEVDSGNVLTKAFCPTCGSQMFSLNPKKPDMIGLRLGSINEKEKIKPEINVYVSSAAPCTLIDMSLPSFDKMPG